jgi:hypothetical protein
LVVAALERPSDEPEVQPPGIAHGFVIADRQDVGRAVDNRTPVPAAAACITNFA